MSNGLLWIRTDYFRLFVGLNWKKEKKKACSHSVTDLLFTNTKKRIGYKILSCCTRWKEVGSNWFRLVWQITFSPIFQWSPLLICGESRTRIFCRPEVGQGLVASSESHFINVTLVYMSEYNVLENRSSLSEISEDLIKMDNWLLRK